MEMGGISIATPMDALSPPYLPLCTERVDDRKAKKKKREGLPNGFHPTTVFVLRHRTLFDRSGISRVRALGHLRFPAFICFCFLLFEETERRNFVLHSASTSSV